MNGWDRYGGEEGAPLRPVLVVLWCRLEPERMGEVLIPGPSGAWTFGRGTEPDHAHLPFMRQRPGSTVSSGYLHGKRISRRQLLLSVRGPETLRVENVGRASMKVDGEPLKKANLRPGQIVEIDRRMLMMATLRPDTLPGRRGRYHPFGLADPLGIVGESPVAWALRRRVAELARLPDDLLLLGERGVGRSLIASAVHTLSDRGSRDFISADIASLHPGFVDIEIFGNVAGQPLPDLPERPGLLGAANDSTLFLDRIGATPPAVQHLLAQTLESGAWYRVGEATERESDFRFIAGCCEAPEGIEPVLAELLTELVELPGLESRREDIPLLLRHLLRRLARQDIAIIERYFPDNNLRGEPRLGHKLIQAACTQSLGGHVRDLEGLLWRALAARGERYLDLPDGDPALSLGELGEDITPQAIRSALSASGGSHTWAAAALGLSSPHQLYELMRRYGMR